MKHKIKTAALLLSAILLFPLISSSCSDGGEPAETVSIPSNEIASLGTPVFMHNVTDKNLKDAIAAHASQGINVSISNGETFSFKIEGISSVKNYSVSRLAPVDKYDPDAELSSYTDMYLPLEYDNSSGIFTVSSDWWYSSTGWVSENNVWSLLICVEDEEENKNFYYFRMIFSSDESVK